jgi:hypothetical protein
MSLRSIWLCTAILACLGSTSASAGLVTVTSYDMYNGNGKAQSGAFNYYDFSYTDNGTHRVDRNADRDGYPLTGGTGILTDGTIATQSPLSRPSQYVGWTNQDPTISFHLSPGQDVSSISLYVASNNPVLDVAAPRDVLLYVDGKLIKTTFTLTPISAFADEITLSGFSISSSDTFNLTLDEGVNHQQGSGHEQGSGHHHHGHDDDDFGRFNVGFHDHDDFGRIGDSGRDSGDEPWILLSEVQFFASAVPEPSTWVLMIAGFAGLCFVARRRGSQQLVSLS